MLKYFLEGIARGYHPETAFAQKDFDLQFDAVSLFDIPALVILSKGLIA
jgi:hypothetical protein